MRLFHDVQDLNGQVWVNSEFMSTGSSHGNTIFSYTSEAIEQKEITPLLLLATHSRIQNTKKDCSLPG